MKRDSSMIGTGGMGAGILGSLKRVGHIARHTGEHPAHDFALPNFFFGACGCAAGLVTSSTITSLNPTTTLASRA
jgi:hypothetical protein